MHSLSNKLLKAASFLVFVLVCCLFLRSFMFITPGRRYKVTDTDHKMIGEVWIPYDSRADFKLFGFLTLMSGLQLWALYAPGKGPDKKT